MSTVPLEAPLAQMLAHIGCQHGPEAQAIAMDLARKVSGAQIELQIDSIEILCRACDAFRKRGDMDLVDQIKQLVEAVKQGPRYIHGVMNVGGLVEAIGKAGENGAKVVAIEAPGSKNQIEIARLSK